MRRINVGPFLTRGILQMSSSFFIKARKKYGIQYCKKDGIRLVNDVNRCSTYRHHPRLMHTNSVHFGHWQNFHGLQLSADTPVDAH